MMTLTTRSDGASRTSARSRPSMCRQRLAGWRSGLETQQSVAAMEQLRIRDHRAFHSMSEREKILYDLGVPQRYMRSTLRGFRFLDYTKETQEYPAQLQSRDFRDQCRGWNEHTDIGFRTQPEIGVYGFYSAPTDEGAWIAACSMFFAGLDANLSGVCLSASRICRSRKQEIPVRNMYFIHGVVEVPERQNVAPDVASDVFHATRDFIHDRSGSIFLLVMSGDESRHPLNLWNDRMRCKVDNIFLVTPSRQWEEQHG